MEAEERRWVGEPVDAVADMVGLTMMTVRRCGVYGVLKDKLMTKMTDVD